MPLVVTTAHSLICGEFSLNWTSVFTVFLHPATGFAQRIYFSSRLVFFVMLSQSAMTFFSFGSHVNEIYITWLPVSEGIPSMQLFYK